MKVQRLTMLWIVALAAMAACGEGRQNVRITLPEEGARFTQGVNVIVCAPSSGI